MKQNGLLIASVLCALPLTGYSQKTVPDAPTPSTTKKVSLQAVYAPPTQQDRLRGYLWNTYGPMSIAEAAIRGGIEQKRDEPSQWPQDGQGYANRFGSAMGQIAIRGTTSYVLSEMFHEDLRMNPCGKGCPHSKLKAAFEDTFMARKGSDGHEALSIARIAAPWSASAVAVTTWYPSNYGGGEIGKQVGMNYGLLFVRNYIRELFAH